MSAPIERIHVVHVDDDTAFGEMAAIYLEREDDRIEVETVTNVDEALARLDDHVDCVVSDHEMPGRDGLEFLERVRERYPDLPFILFTGKGSEAVASEAISAGVTDYLQKETGTEQYELLANRIANAVEATRSSRLLTERTRRLETLISNLPGMVYRCRNDPNWSMVTVEGEVEALTGYPAETLERNEVKWGESVLHPDDQEATWNAVQESLATDGTFETTYRIVTKDGTIKWMWERGRRVDTDDDGAAALEGFITDITERRERERKLRRYERMVNTMQESACIYDRDARFEVVNEYLADFYGTAPAKLEGERSYLVPTIRANADGDPFQELLDGERDVVQGEVTGTFPDAGDAVLSYRLTPLIVDGTVDAVVGVTRDITERRAREASLRAEREKIRRLFETSPVGITILSPDGTIERANQRAQETLGLTRSEITDRMYDDPEWRIVDDDGDPIQSDDLPFRRVVETGEPVSDYEHGIEWPDGQRRWLSINAAPLTTPEGDIESVVAVVKDLTERRERERELERRTEELETLSTEFEAQYRYLFEEAPVMAAVTRAEDTGPVVEDCNRQFVETLGYEKAALVGRDLASLYAPGSRRELLGDNGYDRVLAGEAVNEDRTLLAADGTAVETLLRAVPRRDSDDEIVGSFAFYVDITERKELRRKKERLDEFTSIVSHDIRNPLNVAQGQAELARETCDSEHLDAVIRAHERMQTLIEDLLALARSGKHIDDPEPIPLETLVRSCWLNIETGAATLAVDADTTIRGDRSRLKQLLENLVRNSVEHGSTTNRTESDDSVEPLTVTVGTMDGGFYVEDDGPGIPDADRERVFDPGVSTAEDGTGFGLSIVEQVAEAHGWTVRITDGTRGGTRFEITGVEFVET
ncbi:hybrid sensor histidine kinase/response regulator [Haloplanus pelagicus]|uniref:hybrid sensor histidine kinase/response regulator n=1 Tax=Haloplanus pelagicus TaxID=2949995 RepID=UPI00203BD6A9|nr:PAS domain S-box protein [Haloplanus sp. HW8-1]